MLKKLAKYGNSTTLVIDKAILELLNMDESSIVKLQTDGKSLIITPAAALDKDKVSYGSDEALHVAIQSELAKQLGKKSVADKSKAEELMPKMQEDFQKAFKKNKEAMMKFSENITLNKDFQEAFAALSQKYDPITQSEDYLREIQQLKLRFFPEISELDTEITEVAKKYSDKA